MHAPRGQRIGWRRVRGELLRMTNTSRPGGRGGAPE